MILYRRREPVFSVSQSDNFHFKPIMPERLRGLRPRAPTALASLGASSVSTLSSLVVVKNTTLHFYAHNVVLDALRNYILFFPWLVRDVRQEVMRNGIPRASVLDCGVGGNINLSF